MTSGVMARAQDRPEDRDMGLSTTNLLPEPAAARRSLDALAVGRILLGLGSLASPPVMSRTFGVPHSPEVGYLTRIYGGRAIALGAAYLWGGPDERARLQLLSFGVDVGDTLTGTGHLVRRDSSPRAMVMATALTGTYAVVGAVALWSRRRRQGRPTPA
jgi:hypothetical protein